MLESPSMIPVRATQRLDLSVIRLPPHFRTITLPVILSNRHLSAYYRHIAAR